MIFKFLPLCLIGALLCGCAGLFATNDNLSDSYPLMVGDNNLTIFYNPGSTAIDMAVKNTGSAFITGLSIAFACRQTGKTDTQIYLIGNIKPYFNKKIILPMIYANCAGFTAEYSFIPAIDGGFIQPSNNINGFQDVPANPIDGMLVFKE